MKVIIAGGRDFDNYKLLKNSCDLILSDYADNLEIISGKSKGADKIGEDYAKHRNYPIKEFPANWKLYSKSAGPIRNGEMADYADMLIAFWDGKSRGTADMIAQATKKGLIVKIVNY